MLTSAPAARYGRSLLVPLLLAGLVLRLYFVWQHAFLAADSLLYQDIAQSWLHKGIYGLSMGDSARPTLIRLPGYPMILAALAWLFDRALHTTPGTLRSFTPVLSLQVAADLATCWLVGSIARRIGGDRAGIAALALACLCPFTANYTAVPLTETFTLFFLALAFAALQRWLNDQRMRWIVLLAFALAWSILLRPDQGLLAAAVLPVVFFAGGVRRWRALLLCIALTVLPFVPWTARNYRTFHVIQPLAPKQAIDPGEVAPLQFQRWFRTWAVDFTATEDAYWNYPESPIDANDLPARAFDNAAERSTTTALLKTAGEKGKLTADIEGGFQTLADRRIARHPLRSYVVLPVARLINMLFHPRTEMLPVADRWWQYREHPAQTLFAWAYAALNLAYFAAAAFGFTATKKRQRLLALSMAGYIVLRCLLLLTLDNPEQRYTLEFFPIAIIFASGVWMRRGKDNSGDYIPVTL